MGAAAARNGQGAAPGKRLSGFGRDLCRVALRYVRTHPELVERHDALLVSINDRLGALVTALAAPAGQDIAPLGDSWLDDLLDVAAAERLERAREDGDVPEDMSDEDAMAMLRGVAF